MSAFQHTEELLAEFRSWLQAAQAQCASLDEPSDSEQPETSEIGLYQLVEEFTALRQELKLQTKSTRGLQELTESTVATLGQAIEQFRSVEPKEAQAVWAAGKPLAEALADLDEALDRGRIEIERGQRRIVDESARATEQALAQLHARQRWPWRRLTRAYHTEAVEILRQESVRVRSEYFAALLEGYGLIQNRLQRSLKAEQLLRIDCVGKRVDPERMSVIEVVESADQPPGHVVAEVRRGYTWRGRVLRFAEVRAAASSEPS